MIVDWNDIYDQQQIGIRSRELHNDHKLATTNILSVLIILYFENILKILFAIILDQKRWDAYSSYKESLLRMFE